jgi:RHS repeat-associated protein
MVTPTANATYTFTLYQGTGHTTKLAQSTASNLTESYTYDADGARASRVSSGITTLYFGGIWEQEKETGTTRAQYAFGGGVIAQRETKGGTATVVYLHSDHLGSISVATSSSGNLLDKQEYGPWGNIRSGSVPETTLNYTGQKRDGTGLLYYGARYYDPVLGRFLSPDSIIPGSNPQDLNRYAYVGNNPINATDPTGHCGRDEQDDCGPRDGYEGSGYVSNYEGGAPAEHVAENDDHRGDGSLSGISISSLIAGSLELATFAANLGYDASRFNVYVNETFLATGNQWHDAVVADFLAKHANEPWVSLQVNFIEIATGARSGYQIDLFNKATGEAYEVKRGSYVGDAAATAAALQALTDAFQTASTNNSGGPASYPYDATKTYRNATGHGIDLLFQDAGIALYRETAPGAIVYSEKIPIPPPIAVEYREPERQPAPPKPVFVPWPLPPYPLPPIPLPP